MEVQTIASIDDGGSTKEITTEVIDVKGYMYAEDGSFLEHIEGSDNAFLAKSYSKSEDKYKYNTKPDDLNISHSDFTYISYVVMHESTTNEKELRCIAYASYNRSVVAGKTWRNLLSSSYSSVPNKQELLDENNTKFKLARRAVIYVLAKNADITNGAEFWDGTDFLAWGDSESNPYGGIGQNKFDEYKFIEIPNDIYNTFLTNSGLSVSYKDNDKHRLEDCRGSHKHTSIQKDSGKKDEKGKPIFAETNKKIKYNIPAQEFKEKKYRTCSGDFYYADNSTGASQTYGISATITAGKSIFWKRVKERLTQGAAGVCSNFDCITHHEKKTE